MSRFRAKAATGLLPELLFAASVVLIFWNPLFTRGVFTGRDIVPYALPVEAEIHAAYRRGAMPVWTSNISGGRPLAPNPNNGAFYPIRPLLGLVPFEDAARLFPVIHWIAAGLGVMFLLRTLGVTAIGALVAAFAYTFSGVGVSEVFYSSYHPGMALLPWAVWAMARPAARSRDRVLPLALVLGLLMLAGDVFTVATAMAASLLWILVEEPASRRRAGIVSLVSATVLGALLAAPQIVAAALWAPLTERAVVGLTIGVATLFSVPFWRLLELVVPFPVGPVWTLDTAIWFDPGPRLFFSSLFCGAAGLLSIPVLVRFRPKGARFTLVLAAAAVVVCVVPSFVPAAWSGWRSPIPLRYPEKFSIALVLSLSIAAGLGVQAFRSGVRAPRWGLVLATALAAIALFARIWPEAAIGTASGFVPGRVHPGAARDISAAFAEAGLLWAATLLALDLLPRADRTAAVAAVVLLAAVPVLANRRIARTESQDAVLAPPAYIREADRRDPGEGFRVLDESRYRAPSSMAEPPGRDVNGTAFYRDSAFLYTTCLWRRGTVMNSNPDVADLSRLESLRRLSALFPTVPNGNAIFSSLSLRFGIRYRDQEPLPGFRPVSGNALQVRDENDAALPSVRVPARVVETAGSVEALRSFPQLGPDEIVVESGRNAPRTLSNARVTVEDDRPDRLRFSVDARAPSWVFVLRGFWPYRRVRVDGEPVEAVPAQLAFSAIRVREGRHAVDWKEELPGASVSWFGPLAFLGAVLVWGRRPSSPGASPGA